MGTRAAVVVTGTEVLTGRVADQNGPWLAEQLRELGVDIPQVVVVGDRPEDLRSSLAFLNQVDLIITSGGLGPTADDLTAQVVAEHQGRALHLDAEWERRIGEIIERLSANRGWRMDPVATAAGARKQALVPEGAEVLAPAGTAPGLVVPPAADRRQPPVLVLPGPPRELQAMWPHALDSPLVRQALSGRTAIEQQTIRLWGTPESELAATLREHDAELAGLEITTCLRDGELEIVTWYPPSADQTYQGFQRIIEQAYPATVFSIDGQTLDELVASALVEQHKTIATAESCTAGRLAARLADRAGSSRYLLGGIVSYANEAKENLLGVPSALIEQHGAVSREVAEAMATGARRQLRADLGVGITGVAGPDGGTEAKPVGLVHIWVTDGTASKHREVRLPGNRDDVRRRSVEVALHLIRRVLQ